MTLVQSELKKLYIGSTAVKKVMLGSTQIRPALPKYSPDITIATQDQSRKPQSISNQRTLSISKDGYHILMTNETGPVYEYILSTPWDLTSTITTKTANLKNKTYTDRVGYSDDGQYLYISNTDDSNEGSYSVLIQYQLSTYYDISTAGSIIKTYTTGTGNAGHRISGMRFYDNGTKIIGTTRIGRLFSATLTTAWDISTMTGWIDQIPDRGVDTGSTGFAISADGEHGYSVCYNNLNIIQLDTSTPYNFSTYTSSTRSAPSGSYNFGTDISPDGHYLFVGKQNGTIYRYSFVAL